MSTAPSNYYFFAATILISVFTLGVNAITIIAAATKKSLDKPSYKFILGLAVSDGMMIIAFDRCMSIRKPVLHQTFLTKRLANGVVCGVFVFAAVVSSMPIYWNNYPNERILKSCTLLIFTWSYYVYVIVPSFLTNLICLVLIYIQVYRIAAKRLSKNAKSANSLKMVAVILTCHAVCWFPHMVCKFFLITFALPKDNQEKHEEYKNPELYSIYLWFVLLALSSSFLNTLLYSWRMPDFRKAVQEIIYRKKPFSVTKGDTSTNLYSL
ncbi:sphingosine 1-phosphate receptor 1-like [Cloeon dipterum]|uniref:sphingosine 1-phosphate receptor 1-like n=1 Tax=Cloeon dipterum TaxID=197152 RepID=UPI0032206914